MLFRSVYSRKCLALSEVAVKEKMDQNIPYTIRFKMPSDETFQYRDMIKGDIQFELGLISDFVIIKSDGSPAYNFAVVVDDLDMEITHVIRGEDHISNTPRQVAIFRALGVKEPTFAHMPMILGTDRSKLSKRHGATSVTAYRDEGYLREALFNFLALLGWSPSDGQEILSPEELVQRFSLTDLSKSNAVFDLTKLR